MNKPNFQPPTDTVPPASTDTGAEDAAYSGPSFFAIFLLSSAFIIAGLSVISLRVAVGIGVIMVPALAILLGLISRIKPWRLPLLRFWYVTALVIAVLFLLPGHLIYQMATTPKAMFQRLVMNPVPDGVTRIEKRESSGGGEWVALTFEIVPAEIDALLATRPYQEITGTPLEERRKQAETMVTIPFELATARIYDAPYPADGLRFTAVVEQGRKRMCVVYEHTGP